MKPPRILLIDDQPGGLSGLAQIISVASRGKRMAFAHAVHPRDVTDTYLREADLVLVDLKLEDWPERDHLPISLQPSDGLALVGILRSYLSDKASSPTAFALHTG